MIQTKEDYKKYLQLDALANNRHVPSSLKFSLKELFAPNKIWQFISLLRKVEYLTNCKSGVFYLLLKFYYRIKLRNLGYKLGSSIPINTFGPGLSIPHYGTIIVNPRARVGAFCRLHACVNIGASGGNDQAPQIGDNCYIGPSSVIFGAITIGNNITIGANATVNKSFLVDNVTIAGTPAKIVKDNSPSWKVFNKIYNND